MFLILTFLINFIKRTRIRIKSAIMFPIFVNVIKLFSFVADTEANYAKIFVPDKPFQTSE